MARVLSIISFQSDVGKTFVTVALAEFFSGAVGKRVLVIDLDGYATTNLVGENRWREIEDDEEQTIARLFQEMLEPDDRRFHFDAILQKSVSNVHQARTIDLLPCTNTVRLPMIQAADRSDSISPTDLLWRAVKSNLDDYDIVLVDCGTGLETLTRNALRISDGYVIPADSRFNLLTASTSILSVPKIWAEVSKFAEEIDKKIELHGIVINEHGRNRRPHVWEQMMAIGYKSVWITPVAFVPWKRRLPMFDTKKEYRTLRQKWGYRLTKVFAQLVNDLLRCEGPIYT